mgnify:FL=1
MFGNGYFAKLYDIVPSQKDKAKWVCKIKPTETTREAYELQITDAERDRLTGAYTKEYPKDQVIERNKGKRGRSWFFFCGFNGEETDFLEFINAKQLRNVEFLRQEVELLRIQRIQTVRQIKEALNQPDLYRKQMFEEMVKVNEANAAANAKPEDEKAREAYG